ncbi:hypothetical protein ScPMuIL_014423 [Solemya velum]
MSFANRTPATDFSWRIIASDLATNRLKIKSIACALSVARALCDCICRERQKMSRRPKNVARRKIARSRSVCNGLNTYLTTVHTVGAKREKTDALVNGTDENTTTMSGTVAMALLTRLRPSLPAKKGLLELFPRGRNDRTLSQSVNKHKRFHQRSRGNSRTLATATTEKPREDQHIHRSPFPDVEIPNVSLPDFLLPLYAQYGSKEAVMDADTGKIYTYLELRDNIIRIASGLAKLGYKKGDVLAICSSNNPEFSMVLTATAMLGVILTTINTAYSVGEIAHHLEHSEARGIVTLSALVPGVQAAIDSNPNIQMKIRDKIVLGEAIGWQPFSTLTEDDGKSVPDNVDINPKEDLLVLPYSSGTTGLPKGVMLTHHNVLANILQIEDHIHMGSEDRALGVLPFFHIYGMVPVMFGCLKKGAKLVTIPRFDPELFLTSIQKEKISILHIAPPLALFMAKHPMISQYDTSSLRHVISGAAPLGEALTAEFMDRMKVPLCQGYGLTETSPVIFCDTEPPHKGTIGTLVPNTVAKIVDVETNQPVDTNETGELCVQGPQVMKGYLKNPEATRDMIDNDGWLHTGDIGYVRDDGIFLICDRLKELIKYKGFQVPPAEMESLLLKHPGVQDAGVIGVPDEEAGELPKAFVVCKPDSQLTAEDIQSYVEQNAAAFKKLRGGVEFVDEIPKSISGKILRRVLRDKSNKSS